MHLKQYNCFVPNLYNELDYTILWYLNKVNKILLLYNRLKYLLKPIHYDLLNLVNLSRISWKFCKYVKYFDRIRFESSDFENMYCNWYKQHVQIYWSYQEDSKSI